MDTLPTLPARSSVPWISRRTALAALAGSLLAATALAAEPMEIIVPFGPGSGADQLARFCVPALESALGAPVRVTNVPGSTGNDGLLRLLAAPADGRTVAVLTADTYATLAYANPRWKPSDVIPLGIMMRQPSALFVPASSRFATWQDLEKEARARPLALRVAITGLGSPDYIALQQLAAKNIKLTPVPFGSPRERFEALGNGQADALYEQAGDVRSYLDAGQLRPILGFGPPRPAGGSGSGSSNGNVNGSRNGSGKVPTSGELGLGSGVPQFRAFVVRAGTPAQAVSVLAAAFEHIGASPEFKAFLERESAAADSFTAAAGARAFLERELAQMKRVVDELPMHAQYLFADREPTELPEQF